MKKIPTVFVRDPDDRAHVTDQFVEECRWVLNPEAVPTRKYDGTCMMLDDTGGWWARREVKRGKDYPPNYVPEEEDPVTGKTVGWEPVQQSPFEKFWAEAFDADAGRAFAAGTYELCGPKINGNPEKLDRHTLIEHATASVITLLPRGARRWDPKYVVRNAAQSGWEGIVWHHPDGRMAKLKARDLR